MARLPMFKAQEKQRIVLSVLRGECSVAEAARRNKCSETSIAKWRDQFVQGGFAALEAGAQEGPSAREAQLERELELVLEIADNGRADANGGGGHGLVGMRERVALYGGRLDAGPRPEGGVTVRATLLLQAAGP